MQQFSHLLSIVALLVLPCDTASTSGSNPTNYGRDKRILIQDSVYTIFNRLNALENTTNVLRTESTALTAKNLVLENKVAALTTKDIALENKAAALTTKDIALTTENQQLRKELAAVKHAISTSVKNPVAFRATLSVSNTNVGVHQTIIYDRVQLNEGHAYHAAHGIFMTPRRGIYMFSVMACSIAGHDIALDLMKNTTVVGKVLGGDTYWDGCASETVVMKLAMGDEIYVNHQVTNENYMQVDVWSENSFTGALVQEL